MADAAQTLYPNGPSRVLGNQPDQPGATHPMLDLSDPKYGEVYNNKTMRGGKMVDEEGSFVSPLEDAIDDYVKARKMKKGDTFPVLDPSGSPVYYKYLGPDSGGRKDWMAIPTPKDVPMS